MSKASENKEVLEYFDPFKLVIIGLDTVHREEHPLFDERVFNPVEETMIRNVITYGINQPVNVRQEDGKMLVVDGRQRVRAAREAVKRLSSAGEHPLKVPVRVTRGDDGKVMGIMVSNNEIRQGDDILMKARKAERLLAHVGDINEVAIAFGRTPSTIKNWVSLLEADESLHEAIKAGKISSTAAIDLAAYPKDEQADKLRLLLRASGEQQNGEPVVGEETSTPPEVAEAPHRKKGKVSISQVKDLKGGKDRKRNWSGIKRTWLKKALNTEAADKLRPQQKAVLQWFVSAESADDDWFASFAKEAASELGTDERKRKRKKAAKVAKATPRNEGDQPPAEAKIEDKQGTAPAEES